MSGRRGNGLRKGRLLLFLLEVMFLAALAALAAIAHMRAAAVIAVMAFGWVVVALLEWSSWLDRPHFGRGLPPRFYVPQVSVPPSLPPEQARVRLPERTARVADAETWIAAPASWAPSFDEWPVIDLERLGDDGVIVPAVGPGEVTVIVVAGAPGEDTEIAGPSAGSEGEPVEPAAEQMLPGPGQPDPGRGADAREPARPEPAPPPPAASAEAPPSPVLPEAPAPPRTGEAAAAPARARHRVDPFAPAATVSRRRRRRSAESGFVELPARPPAGRPLPASVRASRQPERG